MKLQTIIDNVRNIKTKVPLKEGPLQPIANFKSYYESKIRVDGHETERLRILKEYHESLPVRKSHVLKTGYTYPHDFERVGMNCQVSHNGRVKITLCLPFHEQYKRYHSQGNNVPVKEKVRLMKLAGYPDTILKKVITKDYINIRDADKNKKFLEKIFGSK